MILTSSFTTVTLICAREYLVSRVSHRMQAFWISESFFINKTMKTTITFVSKRAIYLSVYSVSKQ